MYGPILVHQSLGVCSINHPYVTEIGVRVVCRVTPELPQLDPGLIF